MAVCVHKRRAEVPSASCSSQKRRRLKGFDHWTKLPEDVVAKIVEDHIVSIQDYAAVSAVCRSLRRAVAACHRFKLRNSWTRQMPWLMLTDGNDERYNSDIESDEDDQLELTYYAPDHEKKNNVIEEDIANNMDDDPRMRGFLDLSRNKTYSLSCPQGYEKVCWGSVHGWIVTTGLDHDMYLFNPLTMCRLSLPSRRTFPMLWKANDRRLRQFFINKAVVLKVPSELCGNHTDEGEVILVVAIYNSWSDVAVAKPGDTRWTPLNWQCEWSTPFFNDVVFRPDEGLLLFSTTSGIIGYCNLREQPLLLCNYKPGLQILPSSWMDSYDHRTYITNYGGTLLQVLRLFDDYVDNSKSLVTYKTCGFKVFRLDLDTVKWKQLQDLRGLALFVGNSSTMCVNASEAGCKDNCVYFTDDYSKYYGRYGEGVGGDDIGVFDFGDKSINMLSKMRNTSSSYCCPIWFVPSL